MPATTKDIKSMSPEEIQAARMRLARCANERRKALLIIRSDINTAMHVVYPLQCICAAANPSLEAPSPQGQTLWLRATKSSRWIPKRLRASQSRKLRPLHSSLASLLPSALEPVQTTLAPWRTTMMTESQVLLSRYRPTGRSHGATGVLCIGRTCKRAVHGSTAMQ